MNVGNAENSIYVFSLENDKYFVGITNDLPSILEHLPENEWMEKNKFSEILEVEKGDYLDADKTLIRYMANHGIENVRGLNYTTVQLSRKDYFSFLIQIRTYKELCQACGKDTHKLRECNENVCFTCYKPNCNKLHCNNSINFDSFNGCTRCGRESHWSFRCNRSKDIFGRELQKCSIM